MRKILIILVFVFTFQSLCFVGNLKIEETNFDLRAATFPPPPRPCVFEGISYDMDSRFYELSEDGNPVLTKGQTGYIDIYLSLSGDNCGDVEKTVNVSVENENCISFTKRSVVTRDQTASFNIKALKEGESYVEFSCEDYTISLYFTVVPGSDKYQVMIYKKNSSIIAKDTWSFSSNGNFNSSNLGLSGTWKDLGDDSFSIKIDQKKIKNKINAAFLKIGFDTEDADITIKKIKIFGVFKNDGIKGNLSLDFKINIKNPINTSLSSKAKLSFDGEL